MKNRLSDFDIIHNIADGSSVMIGGFGVPGTPFRLLEELVSHGAKNLTIIKNDANENGMGVDWLLEAGMVKKIITTHIGLNSRAVQMMNEGVLEVEFVPQGIFAERIRAGGSGLIGILTDIGLDTELAENKLILSINNKPAIFESSIYADYALIHADSADVYGNLIYAASAQNFNPLMAMAAKNVIVETETLTDSAIIAEHVHTPGVFVDHLIKLTEITKVYDVINR